MTRNAIEVDQQRLIAFVHDNFSIEIITISESLNRTATLTFVRRKPLRTGMITNTFDETIEREPHPMITVAIAMIRND